MNWAKQFRQLLRFIGLLRRPKPQAPGPHVPPAPPVVVTPPTPEPPALEFRTASPDDMRALIMGGGLGRPAPHGGREWIELVCRYASDPQWGIHQRPNGKISTDILARDVTPYEIFDVIKAEETAAVPVWQSGVFIEPGGHFVRVVHQPSKVRVMPRIKVDGTRFVLDNGQPFLWAGATAFDLPLRVREGDLRFADWMAETGFTLARIVPASVYRTRRELIDGVRDLPHALEVLGERGLYAEVVIGVDTRDYGMGLDDMRAYTRDILAICKAFQNTVAELFNENSHGVQADFAQDGGFLEELVAMCRQAGVTCSAGSGHGGEGFLWPFGDFITHHADRDIDPDVNVAAMADLQDVHDQPVVDDESLGTAEVEIHGKRTADVDYGERQARAALQHSLAGVTFHTESGLTANVDLLGPIQREAARRFVRAMKGL